MMSQIKVQIKTEQDKELLDKIIKAIKKNSCKKNIQT